MSGKAAYADWIAVDWGTTNLRAWAMRDGAPVAEAQSGKGMGKLEQSDFEPALLELIDPWLGQGEILIVACGMVGSRSGWLEATYQTVPARPLSSDLVTAPARDSRLDVRIIPGMKQLSPADVMRGEETQISGFLREYPAYDGVLCLPGTHSKWVQISAGEVVSFRTFMTGEMFSLLAKNSVLRLTVGDGWDDTAFADSVADAMSRPEAIAQRLFSLRAEGLLSGLDGGTARARLSGALIGAELAAARPYWLGQSVALIGEEPLSGFYAKALATQGLEAESADAEACTLGGLTTAFDKLMETTK